MLFLIWEIDSIQNIASAFSKVATVAQNAPLVGIAVSVLNVVVTSAIQAKANKDNCLKLTKRIIQLTKDLTKTGFFNNDENKNNERFKKLVDLLKGIGEFIKSFSDKGWFKKMLNSSDDHVKLFV